MYLSLPMMTDSMVLKHEFFYVNCIPFHLTYSPLQFQIVHFTLNIFPPPIASLFHTFDPIVYTPIINTTRLCLLT